MKEAIEQIGIKTVFCFSLTDGILNWYSDSLCAALKVSALEGRDSVRALWVPGNPVKKTENKGNNYKSSMWTPPNPWLVPKQYIDEEEY